ncbi:MAG: type I methionyl aminopeptidase [Microthrixaceae bacterium]|nr:type I methionyl aminopeptidase [Acidimicrobiales bacterium]MCB9404928.1 type I methionyl aminopeptidase [Microthrixaceae bacterium]
MKPNDVCFCGSGLKFKRCHRATTERVTPGVVSPLREVPEAIERPHYVVTGGTDDRDESMVKSTDVLERMRRTGAAAAEILRQVGDAIAPGVTTDELDVLCHDLCVAAGGYPSPLNYGASSPFPKSVCSSVNEVICHGIPDSRPLRDGDVVNLDVTLFREGVHGDTNATWEVGTVDPESRRLIEVTKQCAWFGMAAVKPGRPVSDIGRAIQGHAESHGFSVVRAFVGHGIGTEFHTRPEILHYFHPRNDTVMEVGMTFTVEPMIAVGAWQHQLWDDGWTAATVDGKRTAQFEHTLVVTEQGPELLTLHPDGHWSGSGGDPSI